MVRADSFTCQMEKQSTIKCPLHIAVRSFNGIHPFGSIVWNENQVHLFMSVNILKLIYIQITEPLQYLLFKEIAWEYVIFDHMNSNNNNIIKISVYEVVNSKVNLKLNYVVS